MSEISFSGPVEVSPELMMALWNAMPATGQSGVAQLFFSRFVSSPISESALKAGAQVFFEREKIGKASATALREGVAERCRQLGTERVNERVLMETVNGETRKAATEWAKENLTHLMSLIPKESLVGAAAPAVETVVRGLAQQYFLKTQEGQNWILGLIEKVKLDAQEELESTVRERMFDATDRVIPLTKAKKAS